jgi:hypothetical protein
VPRRAKARRHDPLRDLATRLDKVAATQGCRKLLHLHLGPNPPHATPGCAECAEMIRQWEARPKPTPSAPKPIRPLASGLDEDEL